MFSLKLIAVLILLNILIPFFLILQTLGVTFGSQNTDTIDTEIYIDMHTYLSVDVRDFILNKM